MTKALLGIGKLASHTTQFSSTTQELQLLHQGYHHDLAKRPTLSLTKKHNKRQKYLLDKRMKWWSWNQLQEHVCPQSQKPLKVPKLGWPSKQGKNKTDFLQIITKVFKRLHLQTFTLGICAVPHAQKRTDCHLFILWSLSPQDPLVSSTRSLKRFVKRSYSTNNTWPSV